MLSNQSLRSYSCWERRRKKTQPAWKQQAGGGKCTQAKLQLGTHGRGRAGHRYGPLFCCASALGRFGCIPQCSGSIPAARGLCAGGAPSTAPRISLAVPAQPSRSAVPSVPVGQGESKGLFLGNIDIRDEKEREQGQWRFINGHERLLPSRALLAVKVVLSLCQQPTTAQKSPQAPEATQ